MGGGRSRYSVGQYSVILEDFEETALPVLQANTDQVSHCCTSAVYQQGLKTPSPNDLAYHKAGSLVSKYVVCE